MIFDHHIIAKRNADVRSTFAEYLCLTKTQYYRWRVFSTELETVAFVDQLQDEFAQMIVPPRYMGRTVIGVYCDMVLGTRESELTYLDGSLVFSHLKSQSLRNWLKQNGWYDVEDFDISMLEGIDWQRI